MGRLRLGTREALRQQPASEQHRTMWSCPSTATRWSQTSKPAPRAGGWLPHPDSAIRTRTIARMQASVSPASRRRIKRRRGLFVGVGLAAHHLDGPTVLVDECRPQAAAGPCLTRLPPGPVPPVLSARTAGPRSSRPATASRTVCARRAQGELGPVTVLLGAVVGTRIRAGTSCPGPRVGFGRAADDPSGPPST